MNLEKGAPAIGVLDRNGRYDTVGAEAGVAFVFPLDLYLQLGVGPAWARLNHDGRVNAGWGWPA